MANFYGQANAKWIVIKGPQRGRNDETWGSQPPAGLSAAWRLAALRAHLVFVRHSFTVQTHNFSVSQLVS
jgi:hypothetical protein